MTMVASAGARGSDPDERARATEEQPTDDERFSLVISLSGATASPVACATSATRMRCRDWGSGAAQQRREHGHHEPGIPPR
jgi:hypothetical protein